MLGRCPVLTCLLLTEPGRRKDEVNWVNWEEESACKEGKEKENNAFILEKLDSHSYPISRLMHGPSFTVEHLG